MLSKITTVLLKLRKRILPSCGKVIQTQFLMNYVSPMLLILIQVLKQQTPRQPTKKFQSESVQLEDEEMDEENGIEIFDEPVAKLFSIKVGNALETLQNLCLFNKNGNEMRVLLQQLESLYVRNSLNSRKQSSILAFFERKYRKRAQLT